IGPVRDAYREGLKSIGIDIGTYESNWEKAGTLIVGAAAAFVAPYLTTAPIGASIVAGTAASISFAAGAVAETAVEDAALCTLEKCSGLGGVAVSLFANLLPIDVKAKGVNKHVDTVFENVDNLVDAGGNIIRKVD